MSFLVENTLQDPKKTYSLPILSKELINHDVIKFVIKLPSKNHTLGLKSGQHFLIKANLNGEEVSRKYTPVNLENHTGTFETIIKIYRPNADFPQGGKMTVYLESLECGQTIDIQGPVGRSTYLHNGNFELRHEKSSPPFSKHVKNIGFVAGGSGITPFLQIIKQICSNPNDSTKMSLIFSNKTENDIICREELDQLERDHPDKFKVWYTITESLYPDWNYDIGYVNKDMFQKHLPPPSEDTIIMVCGPKPMVWSTTMPTLEAIGYTKEMIFKY